jgi:hypothetical protein
LPSCLLLSWSLPLLPLSYPEFSCLAYSSILKMWSVHSSEMSVNNYQPAQQRIPEDNYIQRAFTYLCWNFFIFLCSPIQ